MLGEMLSEERGRILVRRILPSEGGSPRVENSYKISGRILGVEAVNQGTWVITAGPGGVLRGEGQGIVMTQEGEVITWTGRGVGKFTSARGAASFRGAEFYQTMSQKLGRLNAITVIFEHEVDEEDNLIAHTWEWK